MAKKNVLGRGQNAMLVTVVGINDTNPHVLAPPSGGLVIEDIDNVSFVLNTTGNLTGAWTIQASNDFSDNTAFNALINAGTWVDITALFTAPGAVASSPSTKFTQNSPAPIAFRALRAVFTPSGGAGSISGFAFGKGGE